MFKRFFLFLLMNVLVISMISVVLRIFNVQPYLQSYGLDYQNLLLFCLIWGMGGAWISLLLSKTMAKWAMGVRIIDKQTTDSSSRKLLEMVSRLADKANIAMPEVGIFTSSEPNAFATGASKKSSLVAVSSGLLETMTDEEVEGVLGHEISHIANGDMVTMTLLQGVVNAFVMFLARAIAFALSGLGRNNEQRSGSYGSYFLLVLLFQVVFMVLGSILIACYSRYREYRADHGSAKLAGKQKMIHALQALQKIHPIESSKEEQPAFAALQISSRKKNWLQLFATHPPLEKRIARLQHD